MKKSFLWFISIFITIFLASALISCKNNNNLPSDGYSGFSGGNLSNPDHSGIDLNSDYLSGSDTKSFYEISKSNSSQAGSSVVPGSYSTSQPLASGSSSSLDSPIVVEKPEVSSGTDLHATGSDHRIGDVHPFYDTKTKTWYMFYLFEKGGTYAPKLVTSKDMIIWRPLDISFNKTAPMQTYYVLSILENAGIYYSYFGNGYTVQSSRSSDLVNWEYSKGTNIPNNQVTYPAGARDPFVFLDVDNNKFRCISTAYRTNQNMSFGTGMDVSISISSTDDNTLATWQWDQKDLLRFQNGFNGEPECSQLNKLGSRWYLSSSLLRRTNNVGCFTYWIGDAGTKIDDVNWQSKSENTLDSDDLCAPQMTQKDGKYFLWGWIPHSSTGGWGGSLCLTREVYSLNNGKLATKLASGISSSIRGRLLVSKENFTLSSSPVTLSQTEAKRTDIEIKTTTFSGKLTFSMSNCTVIVDKQSGKIICKDASGSTTFATASLSAPLVDENTIRIISEGTAVEVFVNDHSSLCARAANSADGSNVSLTATNATIAFAKVYRLKFQEEF